MSTAPSASARTSRHKRPRSRRPAQVAAVTTTTPELAPSPVEPTTARRPLVPRERRWSRRLPILPALIFTIVVTQLPFVITFWYSLHTWDFLKPGSFQWGGFTNYVESFRDQFLDANYGLLNWLLHFVGIHSVAFTTRYPLFSVVFVLVWQWTPFMMLI